MPSSVFPGPRLAFSKLLGSAGGGAGNLEVLALVRTCMCVCIVERGARALARFVTSFHPRRVSFSFWAIIHVSMLSPAYYLPCMNDKVFKLFAPRLLALLATAVTR